MTLRQKHGAMRLTSSSASRSILPRQSEACSFYIDRFTFDSALGVYKDTKTALVDPTDPSSLCPVCPAIAARKQQEVLRRVSSEGVAWRGSVYHPYDFVKIKNKANDGPCRIGQVHSIKVSKLKNSLEAVVRVRLVGRVATLTALPPQKERDEVRTARHCIASSVNETRPLSESYFSLMRRNEYRLTISSQLAMLCIATPSMIYDRGYPARLTTSTRSTTSRHCTLGIGQSERQYQRSSNAKTALQTGR